MQMRVRLDPCVLRVVVMLVMNIVYVPMLVGHPLMGMFVLVTFAQVQPESNSHQNARGYELDRHRFVEKCDGNQGPCKRRNRKVSPGARRAKMP